MVSLRRRTSDLSLVDQDSWNRVSRQISAKKNSLFKKLCSYRTPILLATIAAAAGVTYYQPSFFEKYPLLGDASLQLQSTFSGISSFVGKLIDTSSPYIEPCLPEFYIEPCLPEVSPLLHCHSLANQCFSIEELIIEKPVAVPLSTVAHTSNWIAYASSMITILVTSAGIFTAWLKNFKIGTAAR